MLPKNMQEIWEELSHFLYVFLSKKFVLGKKKATLHCVQS